MQGDFSKFNIITQNTLEEMTAWRYRFFSSGQNEEHPKKCLPTILKLQEAQKSAVPVKVIGFSEQL